MHANLVGTNLNKTIDMHLLVALVCRCIDNKQANVHNVFMCAISVSYLLHAIKAETAARWSLEDLM